jgi:hypothetical protein
VAFLSKERKVEAPAPRKAKATSDDLIPFNNLAEFAACDAVAKALETINATLCNGIKDEAREIFIGQGIQFGKRPVNFRAIDEKATASIQLKVLPGALSMEAQEQLAARDLPVKITDEIVETFIVNPKYAEDAALFEKLEKALARIGAPEDLFLHQSKKKVTADDTTLNALFRLRDARDNPDRTAIETLLPLVSTLAVKAATTAPLSECLDIAMDLLDSVDETEGDD